jgi:hypothetical protein
LAPDRENALGAIPGQPESLELPAGVADSVPKLSARWSSGAAFLAAYDAARTRFFLPFEGQGPPAGPQIGDRVAVRSLFADRSVEIVALCRVVERVTAPSAGWTVEFERGDDVRREVMLACARGETLPLRKKRAAVRLPIMLLTHLLEGSDGGAESVHTLNISDSGLGFLGGLARPSGSQLKLRIWYRRFFSIRLLGRVTSCEPIAMSNKFRIGVALEFPDERQKQRWNRLVAGSVVTPRSPLPTV